MSARPPSLADQFASSAEAVVAPLIARAKLMGLASGALRALEFPCGLGATTAAMAQSLGTAVGVDPSSESIEAASIMHRGDPRCAFIAGDMDAVQALEGKFDFAYADLRRSHTNSPGTVSAALLAAMAPGGMLVIALRPPRRAARLVAAALPSRHPITVVRTVIMRAGGRIAWIGRGEGDSLLIYAAAPPRLLHVVRETSELAWRTTPLGSSALPSNIPQRRGMRPWPRRTTVR